MVWLRLEPGVAEWKAQTNPLSYGGAPSYIRFCWTTGLMMTKSTKTGNDPVDFLGPVLPD